MKKTIIPTLSLSMLIASSPCFANSCPNMPFTVSDNNKDAEFTSLVLQTVKSLKQANLLSPVGLQAAFATNFLAEGLAESIDSKKYPKAHEFLQSDLNSLSQIIVANAADIANDNRSTAFTQIDALTKNPGKPDIEKISGNSFHSCNFTTYTNAAPWQFSSSGQCASAFGNLASGINALLQVKQSIPQQGLYMYFGENSGMTPDDRDIFGMELVNNTGLVLQQMGAMSSSDLDCLSKMVDPATTAGTATETDQSTNAK